MTAVCKHEYQINRELRARFTQPIDTTSIQYQAFIRKRRFSIEQFSCLLANIAPWNLDGSLLSGQAVLDVAGPFIELLKEELEITLESEDGFCFEKVARLCGIEAYKFEETRGETLAEFPVAAFMRFCERRNIPFPFDANQSIPFKREPSKNSNINQTSSINQNPLDKYLDPNSPDYAPRLAILPEILRRVEAKEISINDGKKFARCDGRDLLDGELKTQAEIVYRETFKAEIPKILLKAYADILKK